MLTNRFREFWASEAAPPGLLPAPLASLTAFILCPCPMTVIHQAQVESLYRIAFEQAQAKVAMERRARRIAFSLN